MRLFITATFASLCFLFAASTAGAYETFFGTVGGCEPSCNLGDVVTLDITFDTQTDPDPSNITLLSVSVNFDNTQFRYIRGLSSSDTYALYTPVGRGFNMLTPGTQSLAFRVNTTDQVNLDWVATNNPGGIAGFGEFSMGTLFFQVIGGEDSDIEITLSGTNPGNILFLGDQTQPENVMPEPFTFPVPEPSLVALSAAALLTLAGVRRRSRKR